MVAAARCVNTNSSRLERPTAEFSQSHTNHFDLFPYDERRRHGGTSSARRSWSPAAPRKTDSQADSLVFHFGAESL